MINTSGIILIEITYILIIIGVTLKVIYDTHNSVKTLAYLLLVIFVPVAGIIFYFTFGVNYRKRKLYNKKIINNEALYKSLEAKLLKETNKQIEQNSDLLKDKAGFAGMMFPESHSLLSPVNDLKLLINGEAKFPEVLEVIEKAKDHIHIEYYIYADDEIGNKIKDLLIRKAKEGVTVRFIYDDFASHSLGKRMIGELKAAGVEAYPFYKVRVLMFANRMNYRNHRKIIVVDGKYGFVGGINVDDRYINNGKNKLFWRDTHLMVEGSAVFGLQHIFIGDWNFCTGKQLESPERYFSGLQTSEKLRPESLVQIISSGPDSELPEIMLAYSGAISSATKRVYLTTPYFIPNETIMNAIKLAALKGIDVRLLVPGKSDSLLVNAASRSNYQELLNIGVRIYFYNKGFVHAKTMIVDDNMSFIGTANMDIRSYDLNFEVNAIVYDKQLNKELTDVFFNDLEVSSELDKQEWNNRSKLIKYGTSNRKIGIALTIEI